MIYIQIGIFLILHFCLRIKIQRHWFCRIYTFSIKFFKVLWTQMIRYLFFLDIYQKNNTSTKKQKKKFVLFFVYFKICILKCALSLQRIVLFSLLFKCLIRVIVCHITEFLILRWVISGYRSSQIFTQSRKISFICCRFLFQWCFMKKNRLLIPKWLTYHSLF